MVKWDFIFYMSKFVLNDSYLKILNFKNDVEGN